MWLRGPGGGSHLEDDGAVAVAEDRELDGFLDESKFSFVKRILAHSGRGSWFEGVRCEEVGRPSGSRQGHDLGRGEGGGAANASWASCLRNIDGARTISPDSC